MLYDVHTHIGLDTGFYLRGWWPYGATTQDLLQLMDANAIDRAVCFPFCLPSAFDAVAYADRHVVELLPGRVPFDRENEMLAQEIERIDADHRLLMLAMFDPSRRVAEQLTNLEKLRGKYVGLKVQATVLESPISALLKEGRPLMEFAQAHAMPVLFHTSILPSDRWSPAEDCLKVAAAFPKARFNLAHSLRFHAPSLCAAAALPNVWVDCSAHLSHCKLALENSPVVAAKGERVEADYTRPAQVLEAIYELLKSASAKGRGGSGGGSGVGSGGGEKYLWGSDNPFMSWCDDSMRNIFSYAQEAKPLHELPPALRKSMGATAPEAWLFGEKRSI